MSDPGFHSPELEHRFAPFVRVLGKGKSGSRSLSRDEARQAFGMILRGETELVQVGAFLMLLRVKEETGEELAGFVDACREEMLQPDAPLQADLDWSSYAGKRQQHPWFILSLMLLAQAGYRVLVHGADGHTLDRLYTETALQALGLPVADGWGQVGSQLDTVGLSYLPLRCFCRPLHELIQLRPLLGLRSPVNTLTRMLNPLRAPCSIQSIFHPAYAQLHQATDELLGQPRALVFKGDSGEVEIKPQADTRLHLLCAAQRNEFVLPRTLPGRVEQVLRPDVAPLRVLWRGLAGAADDGYGLSAVYATTAAALTLLQPGLDPAAAREQAKSLWRDRDTARLD
ncbi:MAG: glycosyl transferase family protein [Halioglobus sp.]|nr:glycosyl transferase family protein [Halioglobus sp.]MCB1708100.1 glycosyl transferase family protein [Halioglobus sp.]